MKEDHEHSYTENHYNSETEQLKEDHEDSYTENQDISESKNKQQDEKESLAEAPGQHAKSVTEKASIE